MSILANFEKLKGNSSLSFLSLDGKIIGARSCCFNCKTGTTYADFSIDLIKSKEIQDWVNTNRSKFAVIPLLKDGNGLLYTEVERQQNYVVTEATRTDCVEEILKYIMKYGKIA